MKMKGTSGIGCPRAHVDVSSWDREGNRSRTTTTRRTRTFSRRLRAHAACAGCGGSLNRRKLNYSNDTYS